jgi:hypothetical protein
LKKLLIISPYFPPSNAADMQRIRMSLPYFNEFGWHAEVVTVDSFYSDIIKDELLIQSVPADIKVHTVSAFSKKWTSRLGLGSLALRSLWYYRRKVNKILKKEKFDLIYFSTTQFPVCALGPYWKNKFGIPYVIDMQDPWYSEYYQRKPKNERPPKFRIVYGLHKILEAKAMKKVDGLISVSEYYINDLKARYHQLKNIPTVTITFGAFEPDLKIASENNDKFKLLLKTGIKNIVYVGRGGLDMHPAITPIFEVLETGLKNQYEVFSKLRLIFIGTSYAPAGKGKYTIMPVAKQYGIENNIVEITDRISYYHALLTLQQADALFILGSEDPKYTASKIYPYLMINKPLLSIFNSGSSAVAILKEFGSSFNYCYDTTKDIHDKIYSFLTSVVNDDFDPVIYNKAAEEKYAAKTMTSRQCTFFDRIVSGKD